MRGEYRGRDYRPVRVYIEQRRSYDARRKRKSVENSTGNSGKAEFSGVKRSIFILFLPYLRPIFLKNWPQL